MDVGKDQEFTVNTRGAGGQGKVDVKLLSPSRRPIPCKVESGTANDVHSVKYIPPEEGPYKVDISYDENPVPGSPFTVEGVMPPDPSKVSVIVDYQDKLLSVASIYESIYSSIYPSIYLLTYPSFHPVI